MRPPVPVARDLEPVEETWPAGGTIVRVYRQPQGPLDFNPSTSAARFRPIQDTTNGVIPAGYGARDPETAIAEVLLRGVEKIETGARRRIYARDVKGVWLAELTIKRPLRFARLHGVGLTKLGLTRAHVIDCDKFEYPYTAEWGQAIHDCPLAPDGIVWTSRQNDSGPAVILWGDRVDAGDLTPEFEMALDSGPGLDVVRDLAARSGFEIWI